MIVAPSRPLGRSNARHFTRRHPVAAVAVTALALLATGLVAVPSQAAPEAVETWTDDFADATLDARWDVVNPSPDHWSLTRNPGALTLAAQPGDTWQTANSAKNVFLVGVPDGDFTVSATVDATVAKVYQGAGLVAWQDMDNYVRSGLTFVGGLTPSGVAVENDVETAGSFRAADFEDRPGSTGERLRLARTGDTVTTSVWDGAAWAVTSSVDVTFPMTHVGLYALAAQDGTSFDAVFDDVEVTHPPGADVVPEGTFTLRAPGDARYLVVDDEHRLAVAEQRPPSTLALTATAVGDGTVTLAAGDAPVVVRGGVLAVGGASDEPAVLRLTDAGGGAVVLRSGDAYTGVVDGVLTLGGEAAATRFVVEPVSLTEGSSLTVDGDATSVEMSDDLYGIFYEDINYAADGGLYAELVRNRSFEFSTADNASFTALTAWDVLDRSGAGTTVTTSADDGRLNPTNRTYARLTAAAAGDGLRNAGYASGIAVADGATYDASVWAATATPQTLTVALERADGTRIGSGTLDVPGDDTWAEHTVRITATATTDAARLVVLAGAPSTVRLDQVSLFPTDTWVGPVNGPSVLRKDLAEKIAALEPQFLRFPGGCVTNVGTFRTYEESGYTDRRRTYQWKETLGPVEERATNWNFWGYNQSYGIGYLEYFLFAEDLGATALPVLSVGANGCGSTIPEMTDPAMIDRWVDDTVDLIEFANGDVTTEWGAVRASLGHPEPFGLRYIGLGNEENTTTFEANFPVFRDAIEARYPDVTVISNSGPDDTGARFDALWQFNREQGVAMVDEHYYNDPSWFLTNTDRYDSYDRNGPHVFLGEYASRGNAWWNALAEAAYMTGLERNSDLVELASYAPLLANDSYVQWSPDAIWFDNDQSWGSPSYYVQQLFSTNVGDQVVPSTFAGPVVVPPDLSGGVFLSTWATAAAYDDVTVTAADGDVLFEDDFADADGWEPQAGTWAATGGEYVQTSTTATDARTVPTGAYDVDWSNYTLELDARKTAGSEGFLVGFAAGAPDSFLWWNLGGWNNTRQALEKADGGRQGEVKAVEGHSIETGRDYHLTIEVRGRTVRLLLDGVLQMEYTDDVATTDVHQVVTRDADTGDLVAKLVNTSASTHRTAVHVDDVGIEPTGTATEIVARPADTNTKSAPRAVVPVERELTGLSSDFTYDLPPYSVTFLRLHPADATPPSIDTVTVTPEPVNGWHAQPVTVTATASDDRGVTLLETSVDGGPWTPSPDPARVTVQVSGDGQHEVRVRATDAAGNVSAVRPVTFGIDATAPVTTAAVDATARTVTLTATDAGAGVERTEVRVGDGAWTPYTAPVTVGAGATAVAFRSVDRLGNVEADRSVTVPAALRASRTTAVAVPPVVPMGVTPYVLAAVTPAAPPWLTGPPPGGTVTVLRGTQTVGTATLTLGTALVRVTGALPAGKHELTVRYGGDARFAPSSTTVRVTVVGRS